MLASVNVPVTVKLCVSPFASVGFDGLTATLFNSAGVTLSVADPVIEPEDAVIVADPTWTPVAHPVESMVAAALDEDHVTLVVKLVVLPFV